MANKVYDANRLRKVYPLIRVKPVFKNFTTEDGIKVETKILEFFNEHQKPYSFEETYTEIPIIALTPEDENVNIFVTSLTIDSMTIESSAPFTGKVHIQVFKAN